MSNAEVLSNVATAQMSIAKSSVGVFELPCGFLDEEGTRHTEVEVREMTGAEEDLLVSKNIPTGRKMSELLVRCTTRIGTIVDREAIGAAVRKMVVGDRVFLMFAIRRVTLGDSYTLTTKCPSCETESSPVVDLSELGIKQMPNPAERVWEETLPSGMMARLRVLTGEGEDRIEELSKKNKTDTMSIGMLVRIEMLGGVPATLQAVKALSSRDRNAIRTSFDAHDGGVDTSIDFGCPHCGHEYKEDMDLQTGFFFPSAARKI